MLLEAVNGDDVILLGRGLTPSSAYALIAANDTDEQPWLPGYVLRLSGPAGVFILAAGCWEPA